jgi:REP element-mobilizing transposase RayT
MQDRYQNRYRISSARLRNWDYGNSAAYFITICTKNREHYFGNIINAEMQLSEIGKIVKSEWLKTFKMRPDMNLIMDEYIIMPNHFHAIIIIGNNKYNSDTNTNPDTINTTKNKFGPQSKNLASVIRGFKIGVTKNARQINPGFAWQSRYHDHIIRNDKSFKRIQDYIINNPKNWDNDKFY